MLKIMIDLDGQRGLCKVSIGNHAFNLSLCVFEAKSINSVLLGLTLSLLVEIDSITSSRHHFNYSKAADIYIYLLYHCT